MSWSAGYKQNRMHSFKKMSIREYANYDRIRDYYAVINHQVEPKRAPRISNSPQRNLLRTMFKGNIDPSTKKISNSVPDVSDAFNRRSDVIKKQTNEIRFAFNTGSPITTGSTVNTSKVHTAGN